MYYTNGNYSMGGNFKIKKQAPMDDRSTVAKKIDLQNPNLFDGFTYNGMIVSVVDDTINNGLYRLEDKSTLTWKKEGSAVDLTNYYTKSETYNKVETGSLVSTKQDNLVSGTNIKTINGQSVLGSGDITISDVTTVKLTENQTIDGIKTFSSNPISTATQSTATNALTRKDYVDTKAPVASPTFTGTVTLPATTSIGTVSSTELGYLDGATSNIQTQLNSKLGSTATAVAATKLATPITINGVAFDGSANITVSDNTKQNTLVSGDNIKTINSSSILDSGNLALLTSTNPSITGSITEQVYNLTGTAINPANGTIQYKTVSANTTFTESLTSGQSVILRLIGANGKTITFPTITWVGAVAPVLTANCAIVLWKEQSTLYGAYVGSLV